MASESQYEYILINSINRKNFATTDAGDCSISFGQKTLRKGRYAIISGFIQNTVFTFDAFTSTSGEQTNNNTIRFNDGKDCTAAITPGYYDSDSLCPAIKSAMDAVGSQTYTVTINLLTNKITISAPANFTMTYLNSTASNVIGLRQDKAGSNSYEMNVPYDITANFQSARFSIDNAFTKSLDFKNTSDGQIERTFTFYYSMEDTATGEMRSIARDEVPFNFEIPDSNEFRFFVRNQRGELLKFNQGGWEFQLKKVREK